MRTNRIVVVAVVAVALLGGIGGTVAGEEEAPAHVMVMPDDLDWQPVPSLPEGARVAVLEGNPAEEGPFTMRLSLPPGYTIPAHTHPVAERVTVLSGTFHIGLGETFDREAAHALPEGALAVMDSGIAMYGFTGEEPTVIQLTGEGPWGITYLDPDDDPRKKQE
jgi:quercetin dioxygenase-like cupin family protein